MSSKHQKQFMDEALIEQPAVEDHEGAWPSLLTIIGFAFLTFNSFMAVYSMRGPHQSHPGESTSRWLYGYSQRCSLLPSHTRWQRLCHFLCRCWCGQWQEQLCLVVFMHSLSTRRKPGWTPQRHNEGAALLGGKIFYRSFAPTLWLPACLLKVRARRHRPRSSGEPTASQVPLLRRRRDARLRAARCCGRGGGSLLSFLPRGC
ncbi:uncharacterized protein C2845_PM12G06800 [Panicum miliaceum]|uniref:Uncharacterized protein n=1 Tax=Panicum miliaceum TaxID=4540 RepID=A0A3L6QEM8_PANMI|nr:uncharacterized protein C2845_PM12G06800 [Panicum miliaceum]